MGNTNIYESLEIKDYSDVEEFAKDVVNRFSLIKDNGAQIIFGNGLFISKVMVELANKYDYDICFVHLYPKAEEVVSAKMLYALEINCKKEMWIGRVYSDDEICNFHSSVIDGNGKLEHYLYYYKDVYTYFNEDCAVQHAIDYSLKHFCETMLFGIGK